ncbi:hypothetical protein FRB90_001669, partial [Tulasnella sp. 427]
MPGRSIAASGVAKALTDTATSHQLLPFLCPRLFPDEAATKHSSSSRRRIRRLSSSSASASPAALALQMEAAPVNAPPVLSGLHQFTPPRPSPTKFEVGARTTEAEARITIMKELQDILRSATKDFKGKATKPSSAASRLKILEHRIRITSLINDVGVVGDLVKALAAVDQAGDALDRIKEAASLDLPLDIDVFRAVARSLESNHLYHLIPSLFHLSEQVLGRTSFRMLEEHTRALVKLRDYAALRSILSKYDEAGLKPRTGTYNRLLQAHLQNCDVLSAQKLLNHMLRSGVPLNDRTYTAVLAGARRMGMTMPMRRILNITRKSASKSTMTCNALLRWQAHEKNVNGIIGALEEFEMEDISRAPDRVLPDGNTYAVIIDRLAQFGDLSKAVQAFAHAMEHGVKPTYSMSASIIKAHVVNRDLFGAYQLLSEMCRGWSKGRTDPTVVDTLLSRLERVVGQAAVGSRKSTEGILPPRTEPKTKQLCNWREMELRSLHFADILEVVVRRTGIGNAIPLLLLMRELDQPMTLRIFRILTGRVPPSQIARVVTALEPMIRDSKDPAVRQAAIDFLLEKRQTKNVRSLRAVRFSWKRDPLLSTRQSTSRASTTVATKHQRVTAVATRLGVVTNQLESLGVCSDRNTYALQIREAAIIEGNTPKARRLLQSMIDAGLKPDVRHYSALIEGYILKGNMPAAKHMMRQYERFLVPAKAVGSRDDSRYKSRSSGSSSVINLGLGNVVLWTLLIVGYGRINRPDQARLAMEEMVREGVAPDAHSVHALAK